MVRRFTHTTYDKRFEELEKVAEKAKNNWYPEEVMGPMHPKIMRKVMQFRPDSELKDLVGHVEPDVERRLLNLKRRELKNVLPNIANN